MRSKIFMYLFIFTFLFTVFIYVNDKKILDAKEEKIENLEEQLMKAEVNNKTLAGENLRLNYFSLAGNEEAISYFESFGLNAEQVARRVENEIIGRNRANEDNDLVPFSGMDGQMRINKVKLLNHKWAIADFTDGTYWGEILLSYNIDEDNTLKINTEKSLLYPVD